MIPHKCPVCNGQKIISKPPGIAGDKQTWVYSSSQTYPCPACNCTGIIWEGERSSPRRNNFFKRNGGLTMITLQQLKDMEPHTVFATGLTIDNFTGINMSNSDRILKWVAVRGGIEDWAIYIGFAQDNDIDSIKNYGDKIFDGSYIKKLVPCDAEAFALYRY